MTTGLKDEHYRVRILRCPNSGVVCEEAWEKPNGDLHRLDGPAVTRRDRVTGVVTHLGYWVDGQAHREDGEPSVQEFDPESGECIWRSFSLDGQYERPDGLPHCEFIDAMSGVVYRAEFRIWTGSKAVLHREDGPALLVYDRTSGEQTDAIFYQNGRKTVQSANYQPLLGREDLDPQP